MVSFNLTTSSQSTFILTGIPGLEDAHIWISIPFSVFYIMNLLCNFMSCFIVIKEQTLHKPMYLLLCMLALTDIGLSTSIIPKALCIFWFNLKVITLEGCLTQIFFHSLFFGIQSNVLVIMAIDRYVAICEPLRYTTILTNERIALLGLVGFIQSFLSCLPFPLHLQKLPFCTDRVIPNTYCDQIAVVKMSCVDANLFQIYSLISAVVGIVIDLTLIVFSYSMILRVVLSISSKKAHKKSLSTCTAHICVMVMFYTPILISALLYRIAQDIPAHIHILFRNFGFLVPPVLNPIIYVVKTKEIYEKVGKYTCRM